MEPSITETNPVAALVFAWPVENVRVSPTSYRVPASSITTSLTLPVLIVSAYLTKDKVMKLKKLGAKGFLAKPIDINNFYNAVNQICPINTVQK